MRFPAALLALMLFVVISPGLVSAQVFTIVQQEEPDTLDPQAAETAADRRFAGALFEGLASADPRTGLAVPGLAESWVFSEDNRTVVFTLREAIWSDGVPITADTVVASWLRKMNPANAFPDADIPALAIEGGMDYLAGRATAQDVKMKALDQRTLEVRLSIALPQFPEMLLHPAFSVIPIHVVARFGNSWTAAGRIVFSGPFRLQEWKAGRRMVLVPNARYWDVKRLGLRSVVFLTIKDPEVGFNLFKSGAADWFDQMPPLGTFQAPASKIAAAASLKDRHVSPEFGSYYFLFNQNKVPFDDVRVRKALAMAVDPAAVLAETGFEGFMAAFSMVPHVEGYPAPAGPAFDPEGARALFAEAGFPGGKSFPPVSMLINSSFSSRRIAELLAASWKQELGVDVEFRELGWDAYIEARSGRKNFDLARVSRMGDWLDPCAFLEPWKTGDVRNDSGYSNVKFDELLEEASRLRGAPRLAKLAEAEQILLDDAALIPLFHYTSVDMIDLERWEGWYPNPLNIHPLKYIRPR
jgi:oligopeptide transport system substrate-binding protein